jgi:hypothetical protein
LLGCNTEEKREDIVGDLELPIVRKLESMCPNGYLGGKHMGVGPEEVEPATIILLSIDS